MKRLLLIFFVITLLSGACEPATPTPTLKPGAIKGYTEIDCSGLAIPDRFTNAHCYEINTTRNAYGMVLYIGYQIRSIGIVVHKDASQKTLTKIISFVHAAAEMGEWNKFDVESCLDAIESMQAGDTETYGDVSVNFDVSSIDNAMMEILFYKE